MDYKSLYINLAELLTHLKVVVCDHDYLGYCYQNNDNKGFIVINPKMTYKEKYFTLAHEAGHLFYMRKGNMFSWSKKPRTEEQANWFAIQLIKMNGISSIDYCNHYSNAIRYNKKRKKSWFEI